MSESPESPRPARPLVGYRDTGTVDEEPRYSRSAILRAWIILAAGNGQNNAQIARWLGLDDETPGFWRQRWLQFRDVPLDDLSVAERLADAPREGAPAKFTPEQVCQIIALACEKPADSDRPISQWSHRELADEIVRRGIVESISPRHAGRSLKRSRSQTTPDSVLAHTGRRRAARRAR